MADREGLFNAQTGSYQVVIPSEGYDVAEWCPTPDGSGAPTAVCLVLPFTIAGAKGQLMLRLKSRARVDELIEVLRKHRDGVWPVE